MVASESVRAHSTTSTGAGLRVGTPALLVALAAVGWWWSARMAGDMTTAASAMGMPGMDTTGMDMAGMEDEVLALAPFLVGWAAMMTAMMFPAIAPVVKLYGRAAAAGRVAPLPFFVAGYLAVWTALGLPAYGAWRALMDPIDRAEPWAGRLAGGVLIGAAVWQLTPLKSVCLRHCRSPISFFMRFGARTARPAGAVRMGVAHGSFCVGCCWALMAVLVALGTMNLVWMGILAALILLEKNAPVGEGIARLAAIGFLVLGAALLLRPDTLIALT